MSTVPALRRSKLRKICRLRARPWNVFAAATDSAIDLCADWCKLFGHCVTIRETAIVCLREAKQQYMTLAPSFRPEWTSKSRRNDGSLADMEWTTTSEDSICCFAWCVFSPARSCPTFPLPYFHSLIRTAAPALSGRGRQRDC